MIVIRGTRPDRNFTIIENSVLRDARLSFRARGVLAFVLSFPDGFQVSSDRLSDVGKEGRDAIRSSFTELETFGYLRRDKRQNKNGQWETTVVVTDTPTIKVPTPDFQSSVNQSSVFQALKTEELLKKTNTVKSVAVAPTDSVALLVLPKSPKPAKQAKPDDGFVLPDWINPMHWKAWRSHAKLRNATLEQKQIAVEKLANWRNAGDDFAGALENSASSGYQGLFLPDPRTGGTKSAETAYQRSMREKMEVIAPSIAAKNPSAIRTLNPTTILENMISQKQLEHRHA